MSESSSRSRLELLAERRGRRRACRRTCASRARASPAATRSRSAGPDRPRSVAAASRAAAARSAMRRLTSSASSRCDPLARIDRRELREGPCRFAQPVGRRALAFRQGGEGRLAREPDPVGVEKPLALGRSSSSSSFSSGATDSISRIWNSSISSRAPRSRRDASSVSSASRASLQARGRLDRRLRAPSPHRRRRRAARAGRPRSTSSRSEFCPWIATSRSPIRASVRTEAGSSSTKRGRARPARAPAAAAPSRRPAARPPRGSRRTAASGVELPGDGEPLRALPHEVGRARARRRAATARPPGSTFPRRSLR